MTTVLLVLCIFSAIKGQDCTSLAYDLQNDTQNVIYSSNYSTCLH